MKKKYICDPNNTPHTQVKPSVSGLKGLVGIRRESSGEVPQHGNQSQAQRNGAVPKNRDRLPDAGPCYS
eukprot:1160662-Pelagomonas_calceolata.AAC.8